jgi:2-haloacid dehalogenase
MNRRTLLLSAVSASAAGPFQNVVAYEAPRYAAVVFDGFPIFDLRPVAAKAEALFPGSGAALVSAWRVRQFEYQWLHALSETYVDFRKATEDGLIFAARSIQIALSASDTEALVSMFDALDVWPDVRSGVAALRQAGLKTAILSNMTSTMLQGGLAAAKLSDAFDAVLSTDSIRSYKPAPATYALAVEALRLTRQEILFAPFAGWDAAGSKAFGFPTFWVNRMDAPPEELGSKPDGVGRGMGDLLAFVGASPR